MKRLRTARVASSKCLQDAAVQYDFAKVSTVDRAVHEITQRALRLDDTMPRSWDLFSFPVSTAGFEGTSHEQLSTSVSEVAHPQAAPSRSCVHSHKRDPVLEAAVDILVKNMVLMWLFSVQLDG